MITICPVLHRFFAEQMRIVVDAERRLSVFEELETVVSATCSASPRYLRPW
jgi:hypothetical protein